MADHAEEEQRRQDAWAGRDSYVAGRDLTVNIHHSPGSPGLIGWPRERTGQGPAMSVEIIVRRRFSMDWESGHPRLAGAEVTIANNSATDIILTKLALKPVGFPGLSLLVGGRLPEKIESGNALSRTLQTIDFTDILDQVSRADLPGEPTFSIHAESGYGCAVKAYGSEPFSLIPRSTQPLADGFNEWTE